MNQKVLTEIKRWGTAAVWVYFTFLFAWVLSYWITRDRFAYLALINTLAVYLFFPLPLVLFWAFVVRRWEVWGGLVVGTGVFLLLWGNLFLPTWEKGAADTQVLRAMTYNVLGRHDMYRPIIDVIQIEGPEVIFIQELNPRLAAEFEKELGEAYPYQVFDPQEGVTGMGVMSKFPLRDSGRQLPLDWVGVPQILLMDWEGKTITLINFHFYPSGLGSPAAVNFVYRAREAQAEALAAEAREAAKSGPVLVGGDANVTDLSEAYRVMTADLNDVWREKGFGFGHTFPGSAIRGSARPRVAGVPVPKWLARIDYLLYSDDWVSYNASVAQFDEVSDHRGVLADLTLK